MRKTFLLMLVVAVLGVAGHFVWRGFVSVRKQGDKPSPRFGEVIDSYNGVRVYYNGAVSTTQGRNTAPDGYNLGLRYQCVEFVKRYYYERFDHRMPDAWGHAKDFFDAKIADGQLNPARGLLQFCNGGGSRPEVEDLIVFGPSVSNAYGHVAIVSRVDEGAIEIIQQNAGPMGSSRAKLDVVNAGVGRWKVDNDRVLGWLRRLRY